MEIDEVKTFLAVLTYGGFHRAAEALNVSQPAISARIRALEASVGASLFARGRGGLSLTPAGKALRPHVEQLLRTVALARQAVQELQPSAGGALRIAASLSVCTYLLPEVMQDYQSANPDVMINLRAGNSAQVLKMVVDGEMDFGVARSVSHPDVETLTLRDDPLVLVGHAAHPAVRKRRVKLEEVESQPLIFYDRGSSDWTLTQGLFRRAGSLPNVVLEVETIEAAKRMVERRLGLSFLPQIAVHGELKKGTLVAIEITDVDAVSRNLDVIHLHHRPLTRDTLAFLNLLRAAAEAAKVTPPGKNRRHKRKKQN